MKEYEIDYKTPTGRKTAFLLEVDYNVGLQIVTAKKLKFSKSFRNFLRNTNTYFVDHHNQTIILHGNYKIQNNQKTNN